MSDHSGAPNPFRASPMSLHATSHLPSTGRRPAPARRLRPLASAMLAATLCLGAQAPARAAPPLAEARVTLGITSTRIGLQWTGQRWVTPGPVVVNAPGASLEIQGLWLDPDPGAGFDLVARNLSDSAQLFSLALSTELAPALPQVNAGSSLYVHTAVDGAAHGLGGGAGVTLNPSASHLLLSSGRDTALGTLPVNLGLGEAMTLPDGGSSPIMGAGQVFTPALPMQWLGLTLSFTLSAQDSVTLIGDTQLAPVPEPAQAALWLLGLAGLGAWTARRHAAR